MRQLTSSGPVPDLSRSDQSIPELIHSIDLQASGSVTTLPYCASPDLSRSPAEASRAVRKKIKHGNTHQQYRALVVSSFTLPRLPSSHRTLQILNALVENCGSKFHSTFSQSFRSVIEPEIARIDSFADGQLTDALKHLAIDYTTDPKVRKKVMAVLASWSRQFKDDPSAAGIAGLYRQVKPAKPSRKPEIDLETLTEREHERERESEQRRKDKEEAKRKVKEKRLKVEEKRRKKAASQAPPARSDFDFERVRFPGSYSALNRWPDSRPLQEKPQVLTAIANASSASNNLVNAITVRRSQP